MKEVLEILRNLQSTTGAGSQEKKIELLKEGFDTKVFIEVLKVAFDSRIVTHIATIPVYETCTQSTHCFSSISELLVSNNINGEIRLEAVNYTNSFSEEWQRVLMSQILTKSLNIGVGVKTINKAYGEDLIEFKEPMLAEEGSEIVEEWFDSEQVVFIEEKFDGNRLMFFYKNLFIDGELTSKDRQSITGKVGSILKGKGVPAMDKDWFYDIFYVGPTSLLFDREFDKPTFLTRSFKELDFDCLSHIGNELLNLRWPKKCPNLPYQFMRQILESMFTGEYQNLNLVTSVQVKDIEEVQLLFKELLEMGQEGLICKKSDHIYTPGRQKSWVKYKGINDCDLRIVGWYTGKKNTKREGFGGFNCESEDGIIKVEVGGGYKDVNVKKYSSDPESYIGKIMKVRYNMKVVNKEGGQSLYLPRHVEIRIDKSVGNFSHEIKDR